MSYVNSVTVYPSSATITKGKWYYGAYASISSNCPECSEVEWYSNSPAIASVNKTTGYIYGVSTGTTRIYAEATDGSGKKDYITVTVTPPVSVTGISVCPTSLTMNVGDTDYLCETVYPSNATNQTVTWCSSNENVATVGLYTGRISANMAGTTIITATTADGGFVGTCELRVVIDTVTITKDGMYSNIVFESGKVWKCNIFEYSTLTDSIQPIDNQRVIHNNNINFTKEELGFLYWIDPKGVILYVKDRSLFEDLSPTEYLIYKDEIFEKIYGRKPRYFIFRGEQLYYCQLNEGGDRYSVYSEAELMFSVQPRWTADTLLNTIRVLLPAAFPIINLTLEISDALFFTKAVDGVVDAAVNKLIDVAITNTYGKFVNGILGWATTIVDLFTDVLGNVIPPEIDDAQINIYENAQVNDSYLIKVSNGTQTVDLSTFIERCNELKIEEQD